MESKYALSIEDEFDLIDTSTFIKNSYKLKPKELFFNELKWKHLIRNCIRGENTLLLAPSGTGKTMAATAIRHALNRPGNIFNVGSMQDARASLIGNTNFSPEAGTFFNQSEFVSTIQTENAVVILDELTRGSDDAWNILMSVLDEKQRYVRLDEKSDNAVINVAKGVSFIATANVGIEYTSTKILDRALFERFSIIEIDYLSAEEEVELLHMNFPHVKYELLIQIADLAHKTRETIMQENPKISFAISTRITKKMASLINDGFSFKEAAELAVYPYYSKESMSGSSNDIDSERGYIRKLVDTLRPATIQQDHLFTDQERSQLF